MNVNICIGNTNTKTLLDSGSVCTIINKSHPNAVVLDCQESFGGTIVGDARTQNFLHLFAKTIGLIRSSVKCNDWVATDVNLTVVEDGHRPMIGRDLFSQLGLSLTQTKQVSNIDQNQCLIKKQK